MPSRINQSRLWCLSAVAIVAWLVSASAAAQTAREVLGAAAVEPLQNESPAKIVIDPPLAESLSHNRVVIQYRTENLHIVRVFGPAALAVSPRIGHVHVTVDDASWVWADASGGPVILNGLTPGPHKVQVQLETASHQLLDQGSVQFTVPEAQMSTSSTAQTADDVSGAAAAPASTAFLALTHSPTTTTITPVFANLLSKENSMDMITAKDGTQIFYKDWGPKNAQPLAIIRHHCRTFHFQFA